jgi:mRNA-degrading endonuclease RelE of RelBE toxin-antitoxin system
MYHTLKPSLKDFEERLLENPQVGDHYGSNIYKVRLADKSKGRGKSGGFRVLLSLSNNCLNLRIFI